MVTITNEIRAALHKFIDSCGSQLDAEKLTGIANTTFSKWMGTNSARMQNSTWRTIYPYIRKYLSPGYTADPASRHKFLSNVPEQPAGEPALSEDEQALLQMFRRLGPVSRAEVIVYTKSLDAVPRNVPFGKQDDAAHC